MTVDRAARALYDAWWQGIVDSRASVGDQPPWETVSAVNRQRFLTWASCLEDQTEPQEGGDGVASVVHSRWLEGEQTPSSPPANTRGSGV